jgi:hypothetical protein
LLPEFSAVGAPISLTHPATTPQSAATASTTRIFRLNAESLIAAPPSKKSRLFCRNSDAEKRQYFAMTGPPHL